MSSESLFEILVVGGGPAGLSAALYAGRARRRIVVVDAGSPRHAVAEGVHNLIGMEGIAPMAFRERAWADLAPFDVSQRTARVEGLVRQDDLWVATLDDGTTLRANAVLLATGIQDILPPWPGLSETWGHSVHICPFCHGWEMRDRPLAAFGQGEHAVPFARMLRSWSDDIVVLTGDSEMPEADRSVLQSEGIVVRTGAPVSIEHTAGEMSGLHLDDGTLLERRGLFLAAPQRQLPLIRSLGLEVEEDPHNVDGWVHTDAMGRTSLPMMWAAGDLTSRMQQVARSIAVGGLCGSMMHMTLANPA